MSKAMQAILGLVTYGPFLVLAFGVGLFILLIVRTGDGFFRYPCQSPEMWGAPQCNPPLCEADGTCTDYLIRREKNESR
jgi:hypothetical protein